MESIVFLFWQFLLEPKRNRDYLKTIVYFIDLLSQILGQIHQFILVAFCILSSYGQLRGHGFIPAKIDSLCFSIACASIVAKVYRDRMVSEMDDIYPGYRFARNKGYGTREHLDYLQSRGPCPVHRHSFKPVKEALECRL